MPYKLDWGFLAPITLEEFVTRARGAGYEVEIRQSAAAPVQYVARLQNGKVTHTAVPSWGDDTFVTFTYLAEKLGIPREVFHL